MNLFSRLFRTFIMLTFATSLMSQERLDLQGHRGCMGLMPENTIPGFLKAIEIGVNTLEMDVVVSMDGQIVVSHEPWMSSRICGHPEGRQILKNEERNYNIYKMRYAEIQQFDCGTRHNPEFPHQQKIPAVKPTLKMVVRSVDRFASGNQYPLPSYNIELISTPVYYEDFIPSPEVFCELVVHEIRRLGIEEKTTLQSSDIRVLEELNKLTDRKFRISYLVEKGKKPEKHLSALSFMPDIYSPYFRLASKSMVEFMHARGIKVIPWTVNDQEDMSRLAAWGVDGIITDYPDLWRK